MLVTYLNPKYSQVEGISHREVGLVQPFLNKYSDKNKKKIRPWVHIILKEKT